MPNIYASAIAFAIAVVFLLAIIFVGRRLYYKDNLSYFSLKCNFPHELIYVKKRKTMITLYSLFFLSILVSFILMIDFGRNVYGYWVLGILIMAFVTYYLGGIVPPKYYQLHLWMFIASTISAAASSATMIYYFFAETQFVYADLLPVKIVALIVFALISVYFLALVCNPRLVRWWRLERNPSIDSGATYSRPKLFILALSEWMSLISFVGLTFAALVFNFIVLIAK